MRTSEGRRGQGLGIWPGPSLPLLGLLEPLAPGHCVSEGPQAQGVLLVHSSSQGSGTMAPPLTSGVLGASWQRCGPAALSCRATRSSTSLPSSASSAAPSPLRCVARLPGSLEPAGCRDPEVSLAREEREVEQRESSGEVASGGTGAVLAPSPVSAVALGTAFERLTSEVSFSSVK